MYVSLWVFSSCHVTNGLFVLSLLPSSSLCPSCLSHNHDHMIYHCMDVFSWRIKLKRKKKKKEEETRLCSPVALSW